MTTVEFVDRLQTVKCFALGLDGTLCLGQTLLPKVKEFLEKIVASGRRFVIWRNHSALSPEATLVQLSRQGLDIQPEQLYTSADATLEYLLNFGPGHRLCVMGTQSLREFFEKHGFIIEHDSPDGLVLASDLDFDFLRFHHAVALLRCGVPFFATHPDVVLPLENGEVMPDCGALSAALTAATGIRPAVFGKPSAFMLDGLLRETGFDRAELAIIGDALHTEIQAGIENHVLSILTLTGVTRKEDLTPASVQPDFVVPSVADLVPYLERRPLPVM